jgi:hypothetical protein
VWYGLAGDENAAATSSEKSSHPHAAHRIVEAGLEPPSGVLPATRGEEIAAVPGGAGSRA